MADITGYDAEKYAQSVVAPNGTSNFAVDSGNLAPTPRGKLAFTELSNGDTIVYKAVSLDDPSKWEVGKGTYDSTDKELDRADADVVASSNSDNRVDFTRDDGTAGQVYVEGISEGDFATTPSTLTDSSGGTTDGTVSAVSGSGDDATINGNFSELAGELNNVINILKNANIAP